MEKNTINEHLNNLINQANIDSTTGVRSKYKYVSSPDEIIGVKVENDIVKAVSKLIDGKTIARYEFGTSMEPILHDGEYAIIKPISSLHEVSAGDAVLCDVNGELMTHMVLAVSNSAKDTPYFLIGSSDGYMYGWTSGIYGIAKGTNICEYKE